MAKIVDKFFNWNASTSPDTARYKVYASKDIITYNTPSVDVGNVTRANLGQLANEGYAPLMNVEGDFNLGVSAVDNTGNESDITVLVGVYLDFVAPAAPTGLSVS